MGHKSTSLFDIVNGKQKDALLPIIIIIRVVIQTVPLTPSLKKARTSWYVSSFESGK